MPQRSTTGVGLLAFRGAVADERRDHLATEEPLEIRVEGPEHPAERICVTMRTPGHDHELAVGFLFTEGLLAGRGDLAERPVRELEMADRPCNLATVRLSRPFDAEHLKRNFYATSSCGICGKASLERIETIAPPIPDGPVVGRSVLLRLPGALRAAQAVFDQTGGLHATGLFDRDGELLCAREDVGRHNAMDKVLGRALLDGAVPLADGLLMVSGRLSFELVQKAAMASVPIVCAVSAPSSLAIQAAERLGITIVGFLRGDGFNVYAHPRRIDPEA